MWRIFILSVRCPELRDVKMTRCSNHSWIQIVLSLVGSGSLHMRQLPGPPLLESPVLSAGDGDGGGMPPILFASFGP